MKRFYIGEPRRAGEGLRIGTVRYPPRGVEKRNYARQHCFDVWMPVLAPSRALIAARKGRTPFDHRHWHRFFASYEREMRGSTEARQTIEMLAMIDRRTPVSVGCHCGPGARCHVTVLLRLLQEARERGAAGLGREVRICRPARQRLFPECVYTIAHPDTLKAIAGKRGTHWLERGQEWVTADKLLQDAVLVGQRVPVLFGNASQGGPMTHWGLFEGTDEDPDGRLYWVSSVKPLRGRHLPQELQLLSQGRKLRAGYQRAYAICRTPGFVR